MDLAELLQVFRRLTGDTETPYRWSDADIEAWLREGEREACVRRRLLHESADQKVCQIDVGAGEAVYLLHPALYELDHLGFKVGGVGRRAPIKLVSQEWLDDHLTDWRDREGMPVYAIQGDTTLRLVPTPTADGLLLLEGYRLPMPCATEWKPEIHAGHHEQLAQWALHRAYSAPDPDLLDPQRAALAERTFSAYFGERPNADMRRLTREDTEHCNKAW